MLFDRENDPFELNNLSGDSAFATIENALERRLQRWMEETEDPFDTGERDPETGMLKLGQELTDPARYDTSERFGFLKSSSFFVYSSNDFFT